MKRYTYFLLLGFYAILLLALALILILREPNKEKTITKEETALTSETSAKNQINQKDSKLISIQTDSEEKVDITNFKPKSEDSLPSFTRISMGTNELVISPSKYDEGVYYIELINSKAESSVLTIEVTKGNVDWTNLKKELAEYLGGDISKFGISVKDLLSNESININGSEHFPPASMAKMTIALLIMRDIEAGKYTLDTTYPLHPSYRFSAADDLAKLPDGTHVSIRMYLEQLIILSSNTAWYHLHEFLGRSYGDQGINNRTKLELGVEIFLDPHIGTPNDFTKLFAGLYSYRYLNEKNSEYLIDLMKNATEWNREGIAQSFINDNQVQFANKIGNLWTDTQISFEDTAIVYGKTTDYVISVMNRDTPWDAGKVMLKEIGQIVHKYLDSN